MTILHFNVIVLPTTARAIGASNRTGEGKRVPQGCPGQSPVLRRAATGEQ